MSNSAQSQSFKPREMIPGVSFEGNLENQQQADAAMTFITKAVAHQPQPSAVESPTRQVEFVPLYDDE